MSLSDPRFSGWKIARRDAIGSLSCLVAIWAALAFPLLFWLKVLAGPGVRLPATPLDETNFELAREWGFLWMASQSVPAGATFTPTADDARKATDLFFLSLGLLPDRRALPSFYWSGRTAKESAAADYRLEFGCSSAEVPGFEIVTEVPGGCVRKRRPALP